MSLTFTKTPEEVRAACERRLARLGQEHEAAEHSHAFLAAPERCYTCNAAMRIRLVLEHVDDVEITTEKLDPDLPAAGAGYPAVRLTLDQLILVFGGLVEGPNAKAVDRHEARHTAASRSLLGYCDVDQGEGPCGLPVHQTFQGPHCSEHGYGVPFLRPA